MDTLFIPNENDFRPWIEDAVKECLGNTPVKTGLQSDPSQEEPLLSRKEMAGIFRTSLVTLQEWMKRVRGQGTFPAL